MTTALAAPLPAPSLRMFYVSIHMPGAPAYTGRSTARIAPDAQTVRRALAVRYVVDGIDVRCQYTTPDGAWCIMYPRVIGDDVPRYCWQHTPTGA